MALEVGAIVEGVVTGITNFGAFVSLPDGKTGLVHISEIADAYVKDINDYVKKNDTVKVKVLSVDLRARSDYLSSRPAPLTVHEAPVTSGEAERTSRIDSHAS